MMVDGADEPNAEPAEALAALVAKLRGELAGVRTAMRNRAVIEQAKGVLVERLGISSDEGFDHLVRLSQRSNIKLIEVAVKRAVLTAAGREKLGEASESHIAGVHTFFEERFTSEELLQLASLLERLPEAGGPSAADCSP